jgi:hypothetical protein
MVGIGCESSLKSSPRIKGELLWTYRKELLDSWHLHLTNEKRYDVTGAREVFLRAQTFPLTKKMRAHPHAVTSQHLPLVFAWWKLLCCDRTL